MSPTKKWVVEHKDTILEVAAIAGAVVAGLACTAVTAGAGAVACMVGAGALINLAKDVAQGDIHSVGDALGSLGTGAIMGLAGGAGGAIAAKVGTAIAAKAGSGVTARLASDAVENGISDVISQAATTGRVDLKAAALGTVPGLNLIGRKGGGAGPARAPPGRGGSTAGPSGGGSGPGCRTAGRTHSFDPATRVLMADGTTRPIADINVGDQVVATDPVSGTSSPKPVTQLHRNTDRELTDVQVRTRDNDNRDRSDSDGATVVVETTPNHPFWDEDRQAWTNASDLTPGTRLRVAGRGEVTVVSVQTRRDQREMRDLTVAHTHTYHVIADDHPVLVHNCGGALTAASGQPHSKKCNCANGDMPRIVRNTGGMRGNSVTRQQDINLQNELMEVNPGWTHAAGGTRPQQVVRGPNGERRFPDLTFDIEDGSPIYVQTVDMGPDGRPTMRETRNALDIEEWGGGPVIMMPKR